MKTPAIDMHCDTISALLAMQRKGTCSENNCLLKNSLHVDLEKLEKGGVNE